jgi:hypothetical protein
MDSEASFDDGDGANERHHNSSINSKTDFGM